MATFAAPSPTVTQRPSLKKKKLAMLILAVSIRNKKKTNNYFVLLRIVFFLEKFGCVCLDFLHPNENNSTVYGEYSPYSLHKHWRKFGLFKNSVVVGCIAC